MSTTQAVVAVLVALTAMSSGQAVRTPMSSTGVQIQLPAGDHRISLEDDPETRLRRSYDPECSIGTADPVTGMVELSWKTPDGELKTYRHQRSDAIHLTVEASVQQLSDGRYRYTYALHNGAESALGLTGFALQTFAEGTEVVKDGSIYTGKFSQDIPGFEEGVWLSFGVPYFADRVPPGAVGRIVIESSGAPRVVGCRAYGGDIFGGWPRDMPTVLQDSIGRNLYRIWRKGFTVGPSDSVSKMRPAERRVRFVESLASCIESGWITVDAATWYRENAKADGASRRRQVQMDLAAGNVTSEFVALADGFRPPHEQSLD